MFTKRDGNLSSLFQRGEEGSLIPRTFVEMIASALGPAPLSGSSVNAYLETLLVHLAQLKILHKTFAALIFINMALDS